MAGTSSINGLISGFQTDDIVSKIMDIAKQPQMKMQADKAEAQTQLATWQGINTQILGLKTSIDNLAVSGAFSQCTATASDLSVVQATAGTNATAGTYYLTIESRAQSHQIAAVSNSGGASAPFTSTTADVGTGSVNFSFSDENKNFSVAIDGTNNTLSGMRDAINKANKGIQASIINSGSASSPAYQLVLSSTATGEVSQFTANADDTIKVDFSSVIQQGTDAKITMGGGGSGTVPISVSKDTNSFDDLIPGVTLSIMNPDTTKSIKVTVARNTNGVKNSIQDFVQKYNDLTDTIDAQSKYNSTTGATGTLMGDWDLQSVQMTLSSVVGGIVPGVDSHFSALATIGITKDMDGHLQINDATLSSALNNNISDVARLFASDMKSDSSQVTYLNSTSDTQVSPKSGWDVNITQAARQAQVTAGVAMTGSLTTNETLTVSSGSGKSKAITLNAGWSLSRVVAEVNNNSSTTGVAAVATKADGTVSENSADNTYLTLKSVRYGTAGSLTAHSSVSNSSGTTSGIGNLIVSQTDAAGEAGTGQGLAGLDVVGTINGETCTGVGQMLTANPSSSKSAVKGLSLLITSATAMQSKVYFTKGLGTSLRDMIVGMTSLGGIVSRAQSSLTDRMADLDTDIADMSTKLQTQQDRLYTQFSAMESQLATLQNQGNYLSQQITAMNKS